MTEYPHFQDSLPTFVRKPGGITWSGTFYPQNSEFPWKTLSVTLDTAMTLFYSDQIMHSTRLSKEMKIGDGLDELDVDALSALVDRINAKVEDKATGTREYNSKKCKKSKIKSKQIGLIRSWRRNFGHLEKEN